MPAATRPYIKGRQKLLDTDISQIVERYRSGGSVTLIATDFGISNGLVCHYAKKAGIPRRKPPRTILSKSCNECGSIFEAPRFNPNRQYCSQKCRGTGTGRSITEALTKNARFIDRQGYWNVYVPEGFISRQTKRRAKAHRAPEHIMLAEQVLGRPLKRGEVVHHVNEDKLDNRKENLLICTVSYHATLHHRMRAQAEGRL